MDCVCFGLEKAIYCFSPSLVEDIMTPRLSWTRRSDLSLDSVLVKLFTKLALNVMSILTCNDCNSISLYVSRSKIILIVSGAPNNFMTCMHGPAVTQGVTKLASSTAAAQGVDAIHVTSHPEACAEGTWLHTDRHRSLDLHLLLHALRLYHDPHYNLSSTQVVDVRGESVSHRSFSVHMSVLRCDQGDTSQYHNLCHAGRRH
jgi:hypothetical protein